MILLSPPLSLFALFHPNPPMRTNLNAPGMKVVLAWGSTLPTLCMVDWVPDTWAQIVLQGVREVHHGGGSDGCWSCGCHSGGCKTYHVQCSEFSALL